MQEIINNLFKFEKTENDFNNSVEKLEDKIYKILSKSSLRLGKLDESVAKILKDKIILSVSQNLPITLILGVGGFKNFRIDSAPHIDWAEVFQIDFLLKSLYEISEIYEPGLHIEYSGDAEALVLIDNIKSEWVKIYNDEFDKLVEIVNTKLPSNIKITTRNFSEFYTLDFLQDELDRKLKNVNLSDLKIIEFINEKMDRAENNFCINGEINYRDISDEKKKKLLVESILKHKFWLETDYENRSEYLEGGINIPVIHTQFPGCLQIKSCKGCDIQYWIGKGLVINNGEKAYPWIMSPKQFNASKENIIKEKVTSEFAKIETLQSISVLNYDN